MKVLSFNLLLLLSLCCMRIYAVQLVSVYPQRPDDREAFYFTPENYGIRADGRTDVSDALQSAINQVKKEKNFGILFIPEGKYRISKTIYIPAAIRLIGYGKSRPEFILAQNAPGFQKEVPGDKGKARYMFWFTGGLVEEGQEPRDANAGTFYSAMSNINLRIEDGNPHAVALRTHYAQHCFVSHMAIYIGKGKAGIFDIGNEMENVAFYGGDYGIYTTKSSPGWPVMLVDAYFEGQRKAALRCQESGLAMVNLQVKNVPTVFDIDSNYCDKLFLENSYLENVSGPAIVITNENNSNNQITFRNVYCKHVPTLARYTRSNTYTQVQHQIYHIKAYDHGLQMDSLSAQPEYATSVDVEPLHKMPAALVTDIPSLPAMDTWVNLRELGAKGDGQSDDTKVLQSAIDRYDNIYVPQGWYRITETLKLKPHTKLIGMHPYGTQLRLEESTPAFSGFGGPKAMVESSEGGDNMLVGIGINTGGINYRAVGVKWMAGSDSYMNDVKFVGGHGGMWKPRPGAEAPRGWWQRPAQVSTPDKPVTEQGKDLAWDNQYWSLWVTNGGGGTFKDIWTASSYAAAGFYAQNTSTQGRIYAMSIEHHVRHEVRFNGVSNWKVYCMQTEEESRESTECQPIEMDDCHSMTFANLYMFRVIRIDRPYHSSVRLRNCKDIAFLNLHNYSQIKYTTDIAVYDMNKGIEVRPWELSRLIVTGCETSRLQQPTDGHAKAVLLASGFEFAEGITHDSKGNIYFCDHRMRRIYKWDSDHGTLSLLADFPWKPSCLAVDSEDNLLVLFRYDAQPGYPEDARPEVMPRLPDTGGTSFSGYGNSGYTMRMFTIDPKCPEESIRLLPRMPMGYVKQVDKALYPSNRWRDFHDFNQVSIFVPEMCFVAPDCKTIIPHYFDLSRCSSLLEARPGHPFYTSDEYDRRMVQMDVATDGTLSNLRYFIEQGEFGSTVDSEGNLYVTDGEIYIFDRDGNRKGMIQVPERPSTLQFGGKNGRTLFITGRKGLYGWEQTQ